MPNVMKRMRITKIVLCCFMLLTISAVQAQVHPSDDRLILYKLDGTHGVHGKYVLCMSSESPEKGKTSLMVIGDTFSVQPRGAMYWVVMTNADILQTQFNHSPSNEVVQFNMWTDVYKLPFAAHTKLVYHDSVVELSKVKIEPPAETNARVYEGEDALRQMKKMGEEPPEDMDMEKAVGHQKKK